MHRPLDPFLRALARGAALALALSATACGASGALSTAKPPSGAEGRVTPVDVRDADFSASLFTLLRDGKPTPQRSGLLVGVVRRQLAHAAARFSAGQPQRGTQSVVGALYLVRAGEGHGQMIDAAGERALAGALERIGQKGDEGRAQALMEMRVAALPAGSPGRAQLEEHLAALDRWVKDTRTGSTLELLGADQRVLVSRALVDGRPETLERAASAIAAWIDRAIEFNIEFRQTGKRPERDEAVQAARALEAGGAIMAALFLRHGDAKGAAEHLDRTSARRVVPPGLYQRIKAAAATDDAASWQALASAFARHEAEDAGGETAIDPGLLEAAVWGTALEAYRRDPTDYEVAALLAQQLVRFGMSEAVPLVLGPALGDRPSPAALSTSLQILLAALAEDADANDFDAARRTYAAAAPLLAGADRARERLDPSAGTVRFLMASIELRAGNLPAALPLLKAAAGAQPSVRGLMLLAMAERQAGDTQAALSDVRRALAAPDARVAPLDLVEAHLLAFELHREEGAAAPAKQSLEAALQAALAARQMAPEPAFKARAERLLGRVLDAYGDAKGAARADERALSAAEDERRLLGATMLDAVGRALVRRDLHAARKALRRGLEANVDGEDLVYGGLWVLLLERELGTATDGTAARALDAGTNRASWTSKLAAWANGKISDADLGTLAQSAAQRVEAQFYTAMAKKVAGDPAAQERLRAVSRSPIIDLLEVQLAREMIAPRVSAELPRNVSLP